MINRNVGVHLKETVGLCEFKPIFSYNDLYLEFNNSVNIIEYSR